MNERSRRVLLVLSIIGTIVIIAGGICLSLIRQLSY